MQEYTYDMKCKDCGHVGDDFKDEIIEDYILYTCPICKSNNVGGDKFPTDFL